MGFIRRLAGCIDDDQEMISAICHHYVVKNASAHIREEGIAQPPWYQTENIDWNEPLERPRCIASIARLRAHSDLPHMRNIEQTGDRARMKMLLEHAQ